MSRNQKYFNAAAHLSNERFSNVDGFDNFSGAGSFNNAASYGTNVTQFNPSTSAPYEFTVTNANTTATEVKMFDSFNARTAANFDNVSGITIASAIPGVTYAALLAQTESKNFECGMTYIQVVSGSNSALTASWQLTTKDASGDADVRVKNPKKSPMQQQADVLEFDNIFKINGYTKIVLTLPASTAVTYSFYPSATVDAGRELAGNASLRGYVEPMITRPSQVVVSGTAAAALRG